MTKGETTRDTVLREAVDLASVVGLNGLTIGELASHTGLSKSGLFRHFGSKEALQVATLQQGVRRFVDSVVRPALRQPRGVERLRALFDGWLEWSDTSGPRGGCLFVAAAIELDDQPGPARDYLVETQREWLATIELSAKLATDAGAFRPDLDCMQFAHDLYGIYLGYHMTNRLFRDPSARKRTIASFDRLMDDATHGAIDP